MGLVGRDVGDVGELVGANEANTVQMMVWSNLQNDTRPV